jgi:isoamylase/glycogen operon protein
MRDPDVFDGNDSPLGFSSQNGRANFALFSKHAARVILGLFSSDKAKPEREIPMMRTNDVWHIALEKLPEGTSYAFRCEGPHDEKHGFFFKPGLWLADPCARVLNTAALWGAREKSYLAKAALPPPFDWEGVEPPRIPFRDLVIYEMHVRGFTRHPSSETKHPGTFLGVIEKIPHLKKLGINAVELMPVFEFDEIHCKDTQPQTGEPLTNYWGYNSLFFFSPMKRFAASESDASPIEEFKTMVRELHRNGIEVILDVVYNHTGEGKEKDYYVNFRGIDNNVYYMMDSEGNYRDYSGCGNTVNCNHPAVQRYILESLRYWAEEMRVDGFRFDLASIFTRGQDGQPIDSPPIVSAISKIPNVKLIAEAWDAAGLYQVGLFPNKWGSWSDWNGRYRDAIRRFIKGTDGLAGLFADALCGSESIYAPSKTPLSSLNFITAHDGYSLRDLVTYQIKHNYENGEMNRDGNNQNDSWNCGAEGPTQDPKIAALREKQMRNFFLALFLSQGVPMLLMGDEYGHSRRGNNNPYVQDNEVNWFLWNLLEKNEKIFSFVSSLVAFRKKHPSFRRASFLTKSDVDWHGAAPLHPDWSDHSRLVAFTLKGTPSFYIAFNADFRSSKIDLPKSNRWREIVFSPRDWGEHHLDSPGPPLESPLELPPYSALLAQSD